MPISHVRDRVVLRDQLAAYRSADVTLVALRATGGHVSAKCADVVGPAVEKLSSADHGLFATCNKNRDRADQVDRRYCERFLQNTIREWYKQNGKRTVNPFVYVNYRVRSERHFNEITAF